MKTVATLSICVAVGENDEEYDDDDCTNEDTRDTDTMAGWWVGWLMRMMMMTTMTTMTTMTMMMRRIYTYDDADEDTGGDGPRPAAEDAVFALLRRMPLTGGGGGGGSAFRQSLKPHPNRPTASNFDP